MLYNSPEFEVRILSTVPGKARKLIVPACNHSLVLSDSRPINL